MHAGVTCGEEKVPLPATFSVELYPKVFKADPGSTSIEAAAYDVIFGYVSGAGHTCSGGSGQQFKGRFTVE